MQELIKAFVLIFIAEMGDKTQILALAFATKFPVKKVLLGIFIGSFLNHGLAVLLGSYLSNFVPINTIQIIAGFAFVGFSLWTLKSDDDEDEETKEAKFKLGPVFTVALAFFIGELGDKTQLTAITLATDASYPLLILSGTVLGMIVTGGIGIFVGKKLGDRIPEFTIKIIAASIFMFFGVSKLFQTLPSQYINFVSVSAFTVIVAGISYILLRPSIIARRQGRESLLKKTSRSLYEYYQQMKENINRVCLGKDTCGECQGTNCMVGYTKSLINNALNNEEQSVNTQTFLLNNALDKEYDEAELTNGLKVTLTMLIKDPGNQEYENIHEIRRVFETLLFNKSIERMESWENYKKLLVEIGGGKADDIINDIKQ